MKIEVGKTYIDARRVMRTVVEEQSDGDYRFATIRVGETPNAFRHWYNEKGESILGYTMYNLVGEVE